MSSSTSSSRRSAPDAVASTIDLVRSRSTIWRGRRDPDVGGEQDLLDLLPVVLGELLAGEHGEQAAAERGLRPGQPRAQPDQPAGRRRRGLEDQPRLGLGRRQLDRRAAASGATASGWSTGGRGAVARSVRRPGAGRVSVVPAAASSSRRAVRRPRPTSRRDPGDQREDEDRDRDQHEFHAAAVSQHGHAGSSRPGCGHAVRPRTRPPSAARPAAPARRPGVRDRLGGDRPSLPRSTVLGRPGAAPSASAATTTRWWSSRGWRRAAPPPTRCASTTSWSGRWHGRRSRPAVIRTRAADAGPSGRASGPAGTPPRAPPTRRARHPAGRAGRYAGGCAAPDRRTSGPTRWCCSATRSTPTS